MASGQDSLAKKISYIISGCLILFADYMIGDALLDGMEGLLPGLAVFAFTVLGIYLLVDGFLQLFDTNLRQVVSALYDYASGQ
ncbi:MAG: hypothetical protein AB7S97_03135, partial [Thermoplasmata archaeon]